MELRHLQYFLMVAREGTISGAANVLHISQPSLSRQMQDLEHELGCTLFERGSRRIELTEAGMRLRKRAEEIVDLVGRTESEFLVSADTLAGEVRIGGGETQAMGLIADVIAELQDAYPLLHFSLFSGNAEDVGERLDTGRIDFGVFIGQTDLSRYETIELPARDTWGVFMREDDPLAQLDAIRAEDLLDRPLIFSRQASQEMRRWFKHDFAELDIVATYNLLFNGALMVEEGIGVAICYDRLANASEDGPLRFRPLDPPLTSDIGVVWKKHRRLSRAAAVFLERLQDEVAREA